MNIRTVPIEALCLPNTVTRKLASAGIATVADLCALRASDIQIKVPSVGPVAVERIREVLSLYGLDLLADEEVCA
ncbi:hypothetical protein [Paraburkholderia mimosarum]|uniref:hypothetical protein n=1 Tax=Paraburkholderia mimosarum TaxID=312026 RepID=UPI00047F6DAE|nr:hypothetical protein [Paraburkholderia mimosarum]